VSLDGAPELTDALIRLLGPVSLEDAWRFFGSTSREQNRTVARILSNQDLSEPLVRDRAYLTNRRAVERARAGEGRQRRPGRSRLDAILAAAQQRMQAAQGGDLERRGARMRMGAAIQVSKECRYHVMPADSAGQERMQFIEGVWWPPILEEWAGGSRNDAAAMLLEAFWISYWGSSSPAKFCENGVEFVQLQAVV
jgi:hypothetical protein